MRYIILTIVLAFSLYLSAEMIPDFTLENSAGEEVNLYSVINDSTVVLVDFWATWCGPCCKELPHLDALYKKYPNLEVLAISTDGRRTTQKAKDYIKEKGYSFTVLHDPKREVQKLLKVKTIPVTFLVSTDKEIFYQHKGYKDGDEVELEHKLIELLESEKLIEK